MKNRPPTVLAHRGLWRHPDQKNSLAACRLAIAMGLGIEVDVRDQAGQLVVAHDVNEAGAYPFSELAAVLQNAPDTAVALNIKSCGLQQLITQALEAHDISHYFVFDMAVPDLLSCLQSGLNSFTRQSEIEAEPYLYAEAKGVWMDMFEQDWIKPSDIAGHIENGKDIAIVSPELHGRAHGRFWQELKDCFSSLSIRTRCYICTDHPEEAMAFFYG